MSQTNHYSIATCNSDHEAQKTLFIIDIWLKCFEEAIEIQKKIIIVAVCAYKNKVI